MSYGNKPNIGSCFHSCYVEDPCSTSRLSSFPTRGYSQIHRERYEICLAFCSRRSTFLPINSKDPGTAIFSSLFPSPGNCPVFAESVAGCSSCSHISSLEGSVYATSPLPLFTPSSSMSFPLRRRGLQCLHEGRYTRGSFSMTCGLRKRSLRRAARR